MQHRHVFLVSPPNTHTVPPRTHTHLGALLCQPELLNSSVNCDTGPVCEGGPYQPAAAAEGRHYDSLGEGDTGWHTTVGSLGCAMHQLILDLFCPVAWLFPVKRLRRGARVNGK